MPPKSKSSNTTASASGPPPKNKNLSSDTSGALKRIKNDLLFKAALEQLVLLDCEAEREQSLYNIGYCSDVVALGALSSGGGKPAHGLSAAQQQQEGEEDGDEDIVVGQVPTVGNDDDEDDDDDPFAAAVSAGKKTATTTGRLRRQRSHEQKDTTCGVSVSKPFNAAALDRALPPSEGWSFLQQRKNSKGDQQQQQRQRPLGAAASFEQDQNRLLLSCGDGGIESDPHFKWFHNRSAKLDRMKARWAAEGLSPEEIARKVML